MKLSRRCFGLSLPFLAKGGNPAPSAALPSAVFRFEDLPVHKSGYLVSRQILKGATHTGFKVDLHESELGPGQMPHPPHEHVHKEVLLIKEGQLEVTVNGEATQLDSLILGPLPTLLREITTGGRIQALRRRGTSYWH